MSSSPARRAPQSTRRLPPQTRAQPRTHGSGTATPEGSATQTITSAPAPPQGLVLRLRGDHNETQHSTIEDSESSTARPRTIQWAEDVVDNEGLGRKKSKVCCIFHKPREVGESSSEDDSSSSSESDGSGGSPSDDDGAARAVGGGRGKRGRRRRGGKRGHNHGSGDGCAGGHGHGGGGGGEGRKPSPNAYEKMPKYDVKPLERQPGK